MGEPALDPPDQLRLFIDRVQRDPSLQSELRDPLDLDRFVAACVDVARREGLVVTAGEIEAVMRVQTRRWIEREVR